MTPRTDQVHPHQATVAERGRPRRAHARKRTGLTRLVPILAAFLLLPGCGFVGFPGVYRINVEQGNLVDQEMIDQLQPDMSRRQVRFIMGSPLVEDTFSPDRWDYPYVIRNGREVIREAKVTVIFEGDRLVAVRGDYLPDWARPEDPSEDDNSDDEPQEP